LGRAVTIALWRANNKPPVELVVANLERMGLGNPQQDKNLMKEHLSERQYC